MEKVKESTSTNVLNFTETMDEIMSQLEPIGPYFVLDYVNDNSGNGMATITVSENIQTDELEMAVKMFENYPEFAPTSTIKEEKKIVYYFKENRDPGLDENSKKQKVFEFLSPTEFKKKINK